VDTQAKSLVADGDEPVTAGRARTVLRCWGARGSIPSPGSGTTRFGGNTSCVELSIRGRRIILDAGSGLRLLGSNLLRESGPVHADIFVTHFHWDHIQGFPFFPPLYDPTSRIRIFGPRQDDVDIRTLFAGQMGPIYFSVPFEAVAADLNFIHMGSKPWDEDGIRVRSMRMRHPSTTLGYRVEWDDRTVCYVPDNELEGGDYPVGDGWREAFVRFLQGTDLLIHDAMFDEEEYPKRVGWGHSTPEQVVRVAREAKVKKLLLFHHSPERTDQTLERTVNRLRRQLEADGVPLQVDAAAEGVDIVIEEV
jgi:phosphoribosyl 1,2-cyclic phosphodiesterase